MRVPTLFFFLLLPVLLFLFARANAETASAIQPDPALGASPLAPKPEPPIQDNSFLVEEAYNFKSGLQIVPGVGLPIGFMGASSQKGAIFYLSFEHPFAWAHSR